MWKGRLLVEEAGHDLSGRAVWELVGPLTWGRFTIPIGFRTNFVSAPRAPFVFWIAGDRAHKEAALHDLFYTTHQIERKEADEILYETLLYNPLISRRLARAMYLGVRWFGQSSWEDETNILQLPKIQALRYKKGK